MIMIIKEMLNKNVKLSRTHWGFKGALEGERNSPWRGPLDIIHKNRLIPLAYFLCIMSSLCFLNNLYRLFRICILYIMARLGFKGSAIPLSATPLVALTPLSRAHITDIFIIILFLFRFNSKLLSLMSSLSA